MIDKAYNYRVDMVAFSSRIKSLRTERKISMRQMEDFFGISSQALYKWERGESLPEIQNLLALSRLLGVSVDDLLVSATADAA